LVRSIFKPLNLRIVGCILAYRGLSEFFRG
jgi:hypothetical protein